MMINSKQALDVYYIVDRDSRPVVLDEEQKVTWSSRNIIPANNTRTEENLSTIIFGKAPEDYCRHRRHIYVTDLGSHICFDLGFLVAYYMLLSLSLFLTIAVIELFVIFLNV